MKMATVAFIKSMDYQKMSLLEIADAVNANGHQLLISQVSDIVKEIRKENNQEIVDPTKGCGINRDANPCGDASDY